MDKKRMPRVRLIFDSCLIEQPSIWDWGGGGGMSKIKEAKRPTVVEPTVCLRKLLSLSWNSVVFSLTMDLTRKLSVHVVRKAFNGTALAVGLWRRPWRGMLRWWVKCSQMLINSSIAARTGTCQSQIKGIIQRLTTTRIASAHRACDAGETASAFANISLPFS